MIGAAVRVIVAEGVGSAARRGLERFFESSGLVRALAAGVVARDDRAPVLNVAPGGIAARSGGIAVQLGARLRHEAPGRRVALLVPGMLMVNGHARRMPHDPGSAIAESLRRTGAQLLHLEGLADIDPELVRKIASTGVRVVVTVHDFAAFCGRANLFEVPQQRFCDYTRDAQRCELCMAPRAFAADAHRDAAARLLAHAERTIFVSEFLLDRHRRLLALPLPEALVISPGLASEAETASAGGREIAFAGSVRPHKGAHLLPAVADALAARGRRLHVLGGGDTAIVTRLRRHPNVRYHGYYSPASLPDRLRSLRVGLALLPSVVPESFSLTMSEAHAAGASVITFDLGAPAERIRRDGGGWTLPMERGTDGIIEAVDRWLDGASCAPATHVPTAAEAAAAHLSLYRTLGVMDAR